MYRGATSDVLAQIVAQANQPCHLFEMYLDTGTAYLTDSYTDIIWNGNNYLAAGQLLSFGGIEETATVQVTSVQVQFSGVDQEEIALFLSNEYIDRRFMIYKAFVVNNAVVVDPIAIFDGRIDAPVVNEDPVNGTCTFTLSVAQHWSDFQRLPGRHTCNADQQTFFPGDLGFEFVSSLVDMTLYWGRSGTNAASSAQMKVWL